MIRQYRHEVTGFLGNVAAATNAINDEGAGPLNYIRTIAPFSPEMMSAFPRRLASNRTNPYIEPKGYLNLPTGLESFETAQCTGGINAILDLASASNPDFNSHTDGDVAAAQDLLDRMQEFVFVNTTQSNDVPRPGCDKQAAQPSIGGAFEEFSDYLHVRALD